MAESDHSAETGKKAAKSAQKADKKQAKLDAKRVKSQGGDFSIPGPTSTNNEAPLQGLSPAERSAKAAEAQVRLHRMRMWISLLVALIALGTFLATVRPWKWLEMR